jgi:putative Ca2+/H+ antiporter (TMEM165/GDT1 family)
MSYLILSYWTVLAAELIGDKSIYTVTSLAMRFRPRWVYCGICAAFLGKMAVAVLFGHGLSRLPPSWISAVSAVTFLTSAVWIWLHEEKPAPESPGAAVSWTSAVSVSFCSLFFVEWADLGQIAAAALVMKSNAPGPVWLGGSLALCTKGALAMALGLSLRDRLPRHLVRALSAATCLVLAIVSLFGLR